eukprot:9472760-Alexandrium_andersonii.AAC.1
MPADARAGSRYAPRLSAVADAARCRDARSTSSWARSDARKVWMTSRGAGRGGVGRDATAAGTEIAGGC